MHKAMKGFTLMEIIVVVILLSIVAAFGIPSYNNAFEQSDEREAVYNLRFIGEALEVYRVRNDDYPNFDLLEVSDINTTLNLGILEQNMDYDCAGGASRHVCMAISNYGWEIAYDTALAAAFNPYCVVTGTDCPSVTEGNSYNNMF